MPYCAHVSEVLECLTVGFVEKESKRLTVHCWKNMVTVANMTRRNMAFDLKSEPAATNCSLTVDHAEPSARCGKCSAVVRFSNMDCALISKNSSSIRS